MSESAIQAAINTKLASIAGLPTIYWPNVSTGTPTANHLRVSYLPVGTEPVGVDSASSSVNDGLLQVSVYTQDGKGGIVAQDIVDQVISAFPRGLSLPITGGAVKFNRRGSSAPALTGGGWFVVPLTIPYQVISKEL